MLCPIRIVDILLGLEKPLARHFIVEALECELVTHSLSDDEEFEPAEHEGETVEVPSGEQQTTAK